MKAYYAVLLALVLGVGCGESAEEKVAPKTEAKVKATPKVEPKRGAVTKTAELDGMEKSIEDELNQIEKEKSLSQRERLELTFNRINNYTSILEKAMEIAEQNSTDAKVTSKVNNPESQNAAPEKLITAPIVERAIRAELKKLTGELTKEDLEKVTFLDLRGSEKITNAGLKDVAKLQKLTELNLSFTKITDAGLKDVAKLQKLERLRLLGTKITDAGLKEVAKLKQLTLLDLMYCKQITDVGLKEVTKLQHLTWLDLNGTKITDAILKDVAKLQKLTELYLSNTKVTKEGVAELQKALPNCFIESNPKK